MFKKTKTLRCLGRSLVRLPCFRLNIVLFLLTFCAFSSFSDDDFSFRRVALIRWQSFDKVYGSINTPSQPLISVGSEDDVLHALESSTFGIKMNYNRNAQNYSFIVPARSTNVTFSTSLNALNITNSLQGSIGGQVCVASLYLLPKVRSMLTSCAALYCNGYVGPGMPDVYVSGTFHCVNIDYPSLLADVLSSTNTVFRQILLGHLNSIQTSVQNIEVNLGGLQSSVDSVGSILNTISNDVSSSVSALAFLRDSFVNANPLSLVSVSNLIDSANQLGYIDYNKYEEWMNHLSEYSSSFYDDNPSDRQLFFDEVVSTISSANSVYGFLKGLDRTLINDPSSRMALSSAGSYFNSGVLDVLGDSGPDSLNSKSGSPRGLAGDVRQTKLQLNSWKQDLKSDLQSWKQDLKDDLQAWKTSDEAGYLNVRRGLSEINSNFSVPVGRGYTNTVPYYAYQTNVVVRIITNVVEQSASDIQSNATSNVDRQLKDAKDRWNEFKDYAFDDGNGINVRIVHPTDGDNHVLVRDDAVLAAIQDNIHFVQGDLTAIVDSIDWFKDGGPVNVHMPSNLVDMLDDILDAITNRPSYILLDDYAAYISNGVYSASIEQLSIDFPNVYTNLQKYGLTSSGDGNFWTLFGANLIYQSGLIGSLLEDMATIRKFADDHIEGGFSGGISSIVRKFPSASHLEDQINSSTGQVVQIDLATTNLVLNFQSVTNIAPSVFKPFGGSFDSPPAGDIVFFKTANDKYVSIPVHDQASVWSLIRTGIGFALVGVQFLLFPKFVLAVVVLFSRLSNRFVKFVPTDL